MGAGGSTAASCSSLDIGHREKGVQQLHEQQIHKLRKQQARAPGITHPPSSAKLRQSNSYFDLTNNHSLHPNEQPLSIVNNGGSRWFDANQSEAYSISNSSFGIARPIIVLPSKQISPAIHQLGVAKKGDAKGVARRIQQQQQLRQTNELRKFSDSLPSLNIIDQVGQSSHVSPSYRRQQQQQPQRQNHCAQSKISAKRTARETTSCKPNVHLVRGDQLGQIATRVSESNRVASGQMIKRAISLSSLHNSQNQHHHHSQHKQQQQRQQQQQRGKQRLVDKSDAPTKYCQHNSSPLRAKLDENHTDPQVCDLKQQCSKRVAEVNKPDKQQQQVPLAKKMLKFKQAASGNGSSQNRYKSKQHAQQHQQGCPVLPPLPRSQSLHELIQLRATENGQRMRNMGTLRGPLANGETGAKVNLVVELLENRRQQRLLDTEQESNPIKDNASSRSSSTDDGIHDISLTTEQPTIDSRLLRCNDESRSPPANQQCDQKGRIGLFKKNYPHNQKRYSENIRVSGADCQNGSFKSRKTEALSEKKNAETRGQSSTLKRSQSHSALQTSLYDLVDAEQGDEESEDLNELTKFLYKFKQRQESKAAVSTTSTNEIDRVQDDGARKTQETENFQQSPNSTTSSSGFASTCTSNSISSSASVEIDRNIESQRAVGKGLMRKTGRKKYPAPPRPDDNVSDLKSQAIDQNLAGRGRTDGQERISSSLLSIVDEQNPTTQSHARQAHNFTSIGLKNKNESRITSQHANNGPKGEEKHVNCSAHQQLEQLKRYTQLRQMSRSELALNHLTSPASGTGPSQLSAIREGDRASKPYRSRLINLIRRISDKSEPAHNGTSLSGRQDPQAGRLDACSAGGHQAKRPTSQHREEADGKQVKAINQDKAVASYSNQSGQENLEQASSMSKETSRLERVGCLSESLCDLNFDCDFELIKNCGANTDEVDVTATTASGNVRKGTFARQERLQAVHSHEQAAPFSLDKRNCITESGTKNELQQANYMRGAPVMGKQHRSDLSKGESNWRLIPSSLSIAKSVEAVDQQTGLQRYQSQEQTCQSMNDVKRADCYGRKLHATTSDKLVGQAKSKWSSGGWLMNNNGGSRDKKLHKEQQQAPRSGKSCLSKLISSSRIPLSMVQASKPVANNATAQTAASAPNKEEFSVGSTNFSKVNNEANQLLDDLDQSLDLVSAHCSPSTRKPTMSWWEMNDDLDSQRTRYIRSSHSSLTLSGSYKDDDDDYATINRVLINATFDVDLTQGTDLAGKDAPTDRVDSVQLSVSHPITPALSNSSSSKSQTVPDIVGLDKPDPLIDHPGSKLAESEEWGKVYEREQASLIRDDNDDFQVGGGGVQTKKLDHHAEMKDNSNLRTGPIQPGEPCCRSSCCSSSSYDSVDKRVDLRNLNLSNVADDPLCENRKRDITKINGHRTSEDARTCSEDGILKNCDLKGQISCISNQDCELTNRTNASTKPTSKFVNLKGDCSRCINDKQARKVNLPIESTENKKETGNHYRPSCKAVTTAQSKCKLQRVANDHRDDLRKFKAQDCGHSNLCTQAQGLGCCFQKGGNIRISAQDLSRLSEKTLLTSDERQVCVHDLGHQIQGRQLTVGLGQSSEDCCFLREDRVERSLGAAHGQPKCGSELLLRPLNDNSCNKGCQMKDNLDEMRTCGSGPNESRVPALSSGKKCKGVVSGNLHANGTGCKQENNKLIIENGSCHCILAASGSMTETMTDSTTKMESIVSPLPSRPIYPPTFANSKAAHVTSGVHCPISETEGCNGHGLGKSVPLTAGDNLVKADNFCASKQHLRKPDGKFKPLETSSDSNGSNCAVLVTTGANSIPELSPLREAAFCHHLSSRLTGQDEENESQGLERTKNISYNVRHEGEALNEKLSSSEVSSSCARCWESNSGSQFEKLLQRHLRSMENDCHANGADRRIDEAAAGRIGAQINSPTNLSARGQGDRLLGCAARFDCPKSEVQGGLMQRSKSDLRKLPNNVRKFDITNECTSKQEILLQRLRSSFSKQPQTGALNSSRLICGQNPRVNYNKSQQFVSPFIELSPDYDTTATGGRFDQMDFADNFILRRKTPTAGLKSQY